MRNLLIAIVGFLLVSVVPIWAGTMADAKKIYEERQDSVIWITGVAKISISATGKAAEGKADMPDQPIKVMALGTIVSPDGSVVVMLSQLDPSSRQKGRTLRTKGGGEIKLKTALVGISELKAVMPDGTEIPSELVMKDENLNLAVVRIKTVSKEAGGIVFPAVDLKNSAEGHVLDEVVTVGRNPEIFNRVPEVNHGYITMITKRPRVFLRASGMIGGCPTFDTNGKLIGIASARTNSGSKVDGAVLIPAADILEVVEQSKKIRPGTGVEGKVKEEPTRSGGPATVEIDEVKN